MKPAPWKPGRLKTKLLSHQHSGRLRAHRHTSYGGLALITVLAMMPVLFAQQMTSAADKSIGIYTSIPTPVPTNAPKITSLSDGKVVTTNDSLTVSGSCQNGTQVKLFKNGVLAGAGLCKGGSFSIPIDLFIGANLVTARGYSLDNIAGPESTAMSVQLVPQSAVSGQALSPSLSQQFFMTSDAYYRGTSFGKAVAWQVTINGGAAPYNITISWGDGKTETMTRGASGQFKISHVYDKSNQHGGNFSVFIQAKDQVNETALLQLLAVLPNSAVVGTTSGGTSWFTTKIAIQTIITMSLIVFGFWIGERHELRLLIAGRLKPKHV